MLDMTVDRDDMDSDGLPDSLRKFLGEHYSSVDASVDALSTHDDALLKAQVEALKVMVASGFTPEQIRDVIQALGKKSTDESTDEARRRQTREDIATLARRRERDKKYQEERRRKVKAGERPSVDAVSSALISSSSLLPLEESKEKKEETGDTRARAHPLPDDWAPNPKHFDLAQSLGHSPQDVTAFAADMRDWAVANGGRAVSKKTNWDAAFNNWIRRQRRPSNVRSGPGVSGAPRKENGAERAVRIAREASARQRGSGLSDSGEGVVELDPSEWTAGGPPRADGH